MQRLSLNCTIAREKIVSRERERVEEWWKDTKVKVGTRNGTE
jgi:hypothetical protein